jgi:hypothetical protein
MYKDNITNKLNIVINFLYNGSSNSNQGGWL